MDAAGPPPDWLPAAILGGFALLFPLFWCLVVWLLSQIGGWSRLAQRYAARTRPVSGQVFHGVTGMVGVVSYRHVLTVQVDEEGFFLEPMVLFRTGHPRLFISWRDVTARVPFSLLGWEAERLTIGAPKIGTISLPVKVLRPRGT